MNQTNRFAYVLLAGIGVLGVSIVLMLIHAREPAGQLLVAPNQTPSFDEGGGQQVTPQQLNNQASDVLLINTKYGAPIRVVNFLRNPDVQQYSEDTYKIAHEDAADGVLYEIFFNQGGGIGISLQSKELDFARQRAEAELKRLLNNDSMIELCSLSVSVTVPGEISRQIGVDYSGINFGLTGCPDGYSFDEINV